MAVVKRGPHINEVTVRRGFTVMHCMICDADATKKQSLIMGD